MKLSDAEWTLMHVLWERSPASARDVLEATEAETGWAYSTVKTMLDRLVDKSALRARKRANTLLYEPAVTRDAARGTAVRALLEKAFDGTLGSLVHHMLSEERLSRRERARLRELLDEHDRRGGA
ncbi:MAG: BlaI/MecI/CopY family transcriptional regulator [Planctomycetota bacterium]